MITISLCMIVKNEEAVLARCLDSLKGLMDEIIIVDTGSTDRTKAIAAQYTDKVYDFKWCDDFSAARNYSFSLAHKDYIYAADADEVLDEANREEFRRLKEVLLPEIEIVQMHYLNKTGFNTTENFEAEYRPKLYKRLRTFTWIHPIHEIVNLTPVVYDSDITIFHMPQGSHGKRDFSVFLNAVRDGKMPPHLIHMYARELMLAGDEEDFKSAAPFFKDLFLQPVETEEEERIHQEAGCVLARHYRMSGQPLELLNISIKDTAQGGCSEVCRELGMYYEETGNYEEAAIWYYNAAFETKAALDASSSASSGTVGRAARKLLGDLYLKWGKELQSRDPQKAAQLIEAAGQYKDN